MESGDDATNDAIARTERATMTDARPRTTAEKLRLFRSLFSGLTHVYGTYDPQSGRARQVKEPVTDQVLLAHLRGQQPYGVYLLMEDRTRAVVADFDDDDLKPALAFLATAEARGISAHIERSKSRGYHVWIFFEEAGVLCAQARTLARELLEETGKRDTEIFPKQDRLDSGTAYGNFINAPLFGRLVSEGRCVFLDPANEMRPYAGQWEFLAGIRRVTGAELDAVLAQKTSEPAPPLLRVPVNGAANDDGGRTSGLPPCAQQMLSKGVAGYQRVACFRLAARAAVFPAAMCNRDWRLPTANRTKERRMSNGSYAIERLDDDGGPSFRLVGPGVTSKWYTGEDQIQRLEDLRDLTNHAVRASMQLNRPSEKEMVVHRG